ncbi:MAG: DNA internalization-related competence protein ComEC/Rec2 [Deltaproteobacteria bacterium]|nr:DNA internalization-related competence protein ComEC/Rec2 [Deltaproteobacteria bacterium]
MRPLVPIAVSFALGIAFSRYFNPSYAAVILFILLSSVPLVITGGRIRKLGAGHAPYLPVFFFTGALFLLPAVNPDIPSRHIKNFIRPEPMRVEGVVYKAPETFDDGVVLYVEARRVFTDSGPSRTAGWPSGTVDAPAGQWEEIEGKVLLYADGRQSRTAGGPSRTDDWPAVKRGDIVRFIARLKEPANFGNPGELDYEWRLKSRGVYVTGRVKEGFMVRMAEGPPGQTVSLDWVFRYTESLRRRVNGFIDSSGVANAGVLKALITGEKGDIPDDVKDAFVKSGTAHLLAISGLHVGFVAYLSYLLIFWILKRSERLLLEFNAKKLAVAFSLLPVAAYGAVSGLSVSTQRAVIMVAAFVFTMLIGRLREFYNTVALAALVVLAVSPESLWDASFELSFAAVIAIVYLTPGLAALFESAEKKTNGFASGRPSVKDGWWAVEAGRLREWTGKTGKKVKTLFFVSLAASLGTYPLLAYHFHRVSVIGVLSNIIAVPITGFLTVPLGLISVLVMPLSNGLALFLLWCADRTLEFTAWLVKSFAALPYASVWTAAPTLIEAVFFYAAVSCVPFVRQKRLARVLLPVFFGLFLASRGMWYLRDIRQNQLRVTFISVGQGDSTLIEFPSDKGRPGRKMLIDGGGFYGGRFDTGEAVVAPFLWARRIQDIDYIVLTHAQRDHMDGLEFIARNFSPGEFWWNGVGELKPGLKNAIEEGGVKVEVLNALTPARVVDNVKIDFLNPPENSGMDMNNSSLVVRLTYGKKRFLFTGDIGEEAEDALVGKDIGADVLKVAHHGSRFSSGPGFLDRVAPAVAIASVGRMNAFGFPHAETVERFKDKGIALYRTDEHGAVTVTTDGERLDVRTYLTVEDGWLAVEDGWLAGRAGWLSGRAGWLTGRAGWLTGR